jgi:hypothetical protein
LRLPVLFIERSRPAQILLGGVIPAAIGSLQGVLIGVSAGAYWAVAAVAGVGMFLAGFEHRDGWGGADRGMVSGAIYATALVVVHSLIDNHAKVSLGSSRPVFIIFVAIISILIGALGGRIGRALRQRGGTLPADEQAAT